MCDLFYLFVAWFYYRVWSVAAFVEARNKQLCAVALVKHIETLVELFCQSIKVEVCAFCATKTVVLAVLKLWLFIEFFKRSCIAIMICKVHKFRYHTFDRIAKESHHR